MNDLGWWLLQNAATTALLVPPVWLLARCRRSRPAEQHLLWLLLLAKLMTPPVIHWPWPAADVRRWAMTAEANLTAPQPEIPTAPDAIALARLSHPSSRIEPPAPVPDDSEPTPPTAAFEPDPQQLVSRRAPPGAPAPSPATLARTEPASRPAGLADLPRQTSLRPETTVSASVEEPHTRYDLIRLALAAWLLGAVIVAARLAIHVRRQRRLLRAAEEAPAALHETAEEIAACLGLRPVPLRVSRQTDSPFVSCLWRPVLVWPASLTADATLASGRGVLAHELAHLRRRDHWVVRLEALASLVWWWNPVFWFLRRRLDETRELACDALAVETAASDRRALAELLLAFSTAGRPAPRLAPLQTGVAPRHSLRRRLAMLFDHSVSGRVSAEGFALAALLACVTLPGWSRAQEEPPVTATTPQAAPEADPVPPLKEFAPSEDVVSEDTPPESLPPSAQHASDVPMETGPKAGPGPKQPDPDTPTAPGPQPAKAQETPQTTPALPEPNRQVKPPFEIDLGGGKRVRIESSRDRKNLVLQVFENGKLRLSETVEGPWITGLQLRDAAERGHEIGILFFTAKWSGPDQRMRPLVQALIDEGVPVRIVDVDQQPETVKQYGVTGVPTAISVRDGRVIERVVGVHSEQELRRLVESLVSANQPSPVTPSNSFPNLMQADRSNRPDTATRVRLLQNALDLALLDVEEARVQLENGKLKQARQQKLYETGYAAQPPDDVRLLELDLKRAQLRAEQARLQLEAAAQPQPQPAPAADSPAAATPPDSNLAALEAAYDMARLEVEEKQVLLDQARQEQARLERLVEKGVVSQAERPDTRLQEIELKKAQLKLNQAKAALDAARPPSLPPANAPR